MPVFKAATVLRLLPIPIVLIIYYTFVQIRIHSDATYFRLPLWATTNAPPSFRTKAATASSFNLTETKSTFSPAMKDFWNDLSLSLEDARPQCPPLQVKDGHPTSLETTFEPLNISKIPPARLVNFTDEHETVLSASHYLMRNSVQRLAPRLVFSKGSQGIVTTANPKYIPIFLVSLRMLRRTGCQLPVEVFIDNWTKYDPIVCDSVLPSLNAACVVLSEIYDTAPNIRPPASYQFKLFALLFSSFQHTLFFDSDAFPAHDPTSLFSTHPYTTHGLVVWPDLFGLTVSEHYYHIAGIPYESPSTRPSTESGIVLLDKEKQRESLLMMVYYNYYGPEYYYSLLCQGSHGAGDKETFVQAAMAVGAPWYQVKTGVVGLGYFEHGKYRLSGLAQMDPRSDFAYGPPSKSHIHPENRWQEAEGGGWEAQVRPKPWFVHQNMHKLNPTRILEMDGTTAKTRSGNYTRMWGDREGVVEMFGYDVERRVWEVIVEEGCRLDEASEVCMKLGEYFAEVFGTVDSIDE
ncbi:glycosyltransferase family 71 protein [Macroventuria anomochaeta]|uniref:Glycosyltransferase family 71 protein n=1 Tax=Macroventuria anomochaeta TaxID=301207 RepID=A0ACB6RZL7_9PLEO|nr:glycosyltransferase family 71 protein [Macroventuria anomochaeta]KAF2626594.1 glycosyltransferase family 71 protein [Macroventuria anomochaeta]